MAIVTTYVCDVSGKQGSSEDFVKIMICPSKANYQSTFKTVSNIDKLIHKDVALKLNLIFPEPDKAAQPEPTLESKLLVLLKEYISDIAYEAGSEAGSEAASNRG